MAARVVTRVPLTATMRWPTGTPARCATPLTLSTRPWGSVTKPNPPLATCVSLIVSSALDITDPDMAKLASLPNEKRSLEALVAAGAGAAAVAMLPTESPNENKSFDPPAGAGAGAAAGDANNAMH